MGAGPRNTHSLPPPPTSNRNIKHYIQFTKDTSNRCSNVIRGRVTVQHINPTLTWRGIRIELPRLAVPNENSFMDEVSWCPVRRRALSFPPFGSYACMCSWCRFESLSMARWMSLAKMETQPDERYSSVVEIMDGNVICTVHLPITHLIPSGCRIASVEKFVWHPAPFQSPIIGFGSKVTTIPKSSAQRCRMYLDTHSWSPMAIPSHGPTYGVSIDEINQCPFPLQSIKYILTTVPDTPIGQA